MRYSAQMLLRIWALAAAILSLSCAESLGGICDDAVQAFYRCGGAPQPGDMSACIDRYETSSGACERAFSDRLDCTYGVACSDEDAVCGDVLDAEAYDCDNDPIVPPY